METGFTFLHFSVILEMLIYFSNDDDNNNNNNNNKTINHDRCKLSFLYLLMFYFHFKACRLEHENKVKKWENMFVKIVSGKGHRRRWRFLTAWFKSKAKQG